ncbi:hypothetical protein BD626DRAFT_91079 [Schizophyllum amplum]|uniref:Uncharacterized protein n=1 Tax=Schizophyllum amplum TaxID=97359 RepID=A0A550C8M8_9AGAR|nr:hypothetical protein BD626DRAFT_91079 [Auriculariopsis ampla]
MFEPPSPPVQAPDNRPLPISEEPELHYENQHTDPQNVGASGSINPPSTASHALSTNGTLAPPPMSRTPSPHPFTFTCSTGKRPLAQSTPYNGPSLMPPGAVGAALSSAAAAAQQTPGRPDAAHVKPSTQTTPLRLFHFQYDTYTRDHLSALVDSIAVTPSSGASDGSSPRVGPMALSPITGMSPSFPGEDHTQDRHPFGLSPITSSSAGFSQSDLVSPTGGAHEEQDGRIPDLRAIKRVRLSPASDFDEQDGNGASYGEGAGAGASISRPRAAGTPAKGFIHSPALHVPGSATKNHRPSPLSIQHLSSHDSFNRRSANGRGNYRPSPLSAHVLVSSPSPSKGRGTQEEPTSPVLRSSVTARPSKSDPRLPRLAVPNAGAGVSRTPSPVEGSSGESSPRKRLMGADYLQASRSLMQQIAAQQKERDFSTVSSTRSGGTSFVSAGRERTERSVLSASGRERTQGSVVIHEDASQRDDHPDEERRPYQSATTNAFFLQRANDLMNLIKGDVTVSSVATNHTRRESTTTTHSRNPSDATSTGRLEPIEDTSHGLRASGNMVPHVRTETGMTGTTLGSSMRKSSSKDLAASTRPRLPSTHRMASGSTQRTVSGSSDATAFNAPGPSTRPPSFGSSMRSSFSRVPSNEAPSSLGTATSEATVADPARPTDTLTREDMRRFVSAASTAGTVATVESGVKHGSYGNVTGAGQPRRGFIPGTAFNPANLPPPTMLPAPPSPSNPRMAVISELPTHARRRRQRPSALALVGASPLSHPQI